MAFTQPCFIRNNTPELRKKLEELGYKNRHLFMVTNVEKYPLLQVYRDGFYDGIIGDECGLEFYIDCRTNEELFLALAALRDDSDYMQWFICDDNESMFKVNKPNMTMDEFIYNYMDGWNTDGARKATAKEIIKHFKDK